MGKRWNGRKMSRTKHPKPRSTKSTRAVKPAPKAKRAKSLTKDA